MYEFVHVVLLVVAQSLLLGLLKRLIDYSSTSILLTIYSHIQLIWNKVCFQTFLEKRKKTYAIIFGAHSYCT